MQTLVLCDDYWHPARVPQEGLRDLEKDGFSFDWIEDDEPVCGADDEVPAGDPDKIQ